ncbi:MAG: sugar ABC transporter substrate-binding protein [Lachnospiraceae bacterium]
MKRKVLGLVLSAIVAVTLVACGGQSSDTNTDTSTDAATEAQTDTAAEDVSITMILKATTAEYWQYMIAGAKAAGTDLGITVDVIGPTDESQIAQQVTQIEEQIAAGVSALVIAPCEENAVIGATQPYVDQLPILMVDSDVTMEGKKAFIGTGNENAAKLGGAYVAEQLGEGAKAVLIGGQQGEATQAARLSGFELGLTEGGMEVLETQYGNNTADKSMAVMEDLLTKYPDEIDAVLCINDDEAIGVQQACANAGVTDILILGFNGDQGAVDLILNDGGITATVAQQPYNMAYQAIEQAYKAVQGETIEENQEVDAQLITKENAQEYLDTQAEQLGK